MTLVCEACGSHEITTLVATHNPGGGFERYECETCGGTGTLRYDATTGPTFAGCVTRDLHAGSPRRIRRG
jgi:transposase-like protein